mmetsp:Transcript_14132/g.11380  ORF Transcript_14132/g.11380 Transcript_14132/m.11380 type:complete len:99 (+) Transcript_14132:141-437(+)
MPLRSEGVRSHFGSSHFGLRGISARASGAAAAPSGAGRRPCNETGSALSRASVRAPRRPRHCRELEWCPQVLGVHIGPLSCRYVARGSVAILAQAILA